MVKIPDFSKLVEKIDLKGISDTVKSIIHPGSVIPEGIEGDPIAFQLVEISKLAEKISVTHVQQAEDLAELKKKINAIFHYLKEHADKGGENPTPKETESKETTAKQTRVPGSQDKPQN